jgi:GTP diphosphokinase / guanosine-3',5'-bis(diphosphate) 3'-diphosphatase
MDYGAAIRERMLSSVWRPPDDFGRLTAQLETYLARGDIDAITEAYDFSAKAHEGQQRRSGDPYITHPVAVAEILATLHLDADSIKAALLHDVIEDTTTDLGEIEERFGPQVARLVGEMTEDERIEPYEERKAEHRHRVARDRSVAAIYAADKLSRTEELLADDPATTERPRLDHYVRTFRELSEAYPDLPFLGELHTELELIERARAARDDG